MSSYIPDSAPPAPDQPSYPHPDLAWEVRKITIPTTTGTLQLTTVGGHIMALIVEETTGSASARFELWDGTTTGGEYIGPWTLSSGQSFDNAYPPHGLVFRNGLFLNVTTGSVAGAVHIGTRVPWPIAHAE